MDFLKWGCMSYLFIVSVLPAVDLGRHEADRSTGTEAKQCTAVDGTSSKTYFSPLKKGPPKNVNISLSVRYI